MTVFDPYSRYRSLEAYVEWTSADAEWVRRAWPTVSPWVPQFMDDFYTTIERHPETSRVITGGTVQIDRLKESLRTWIRQLFLGPHNEKYVMARRQVGRRHVAIGLPQSYVNAALARLRVQITRCLQEKWLVPEEVAPITQAISKRIDLDLAIIEDAYQSEYLTIQQPIHESRLRQQRAVVELGRRALATTSLDSLFELATALAADALAADQVMVLELIPPPFRVAVRAAYGMREPRFSPLEFSFPFAEEDLVGRSMKEEAIVVIDDFRREPRLRVLGLAGGAEVMSAACAPIHGEQGIWGALLVHSTRARSFVAIDQDCLHATSHVLSGAIQRSQAEFRMRQAERLAGIGQMVTGIAHESRNALQRIQACTEMLQLELPTKAPHQQWIERIGRAADDLHRLFEQVRQFAAPMVLERIELDPIPLLKKVWSETRQVHSDRDLELETVDGTSPKVQGDPYRLAQVFHNLFENSLAACEDPVRIKVSVREVSEGTRQYVILSWSDNGPGFDPYHVARVFEPFFTTKTKGTGLGLSICHRILEAHGGSIEIDTGVYSGATLVLRLPKA